MLLYTKHNILTQKNIAFETLTYLRSFFSGGDFLNHPWQMISPPLILQKEKHNHDSNITLKSSDDAGPSMLNAWGAVVWM